MKNHTISDLNAKAWYRLLKVCFVIAVIIVLGIYNILVFSNGVKQVDENKTAIKCGYGLADNEATFSPKDIGITFESSDFVDGKLDYKAFFESFNDYSIGAILKKCYPKSTGDIYDSQRQVELMSENGFITASGSLSDSISPEQMDAYQTGYNSYKQETKYLFANTKASYLDFSYKMFDVTPQFSYTEFLLLFILGNIGFLMGFEVIRRIFYYVVLGSFRPKKHQ